MSIARAAAKAMLSDALLQEGPAINRLSHLELELPLDKVIKYVSVGLPLVLVCMAFAREISLGEPHSTSFHLHTPSYHIISHRHHMSMMFYTSLSLFLSLFLILWALLAFSYLLFICLAT